MKSPRILLAGANRRPQKSLGQNFLIDPNIPEAIVHRSKITAEEVVLEIGAGLGALTFPLSSVAQKVYAVEKDPVLVQLLESEMLSLQRRNIIIIEADALRLDLSTFMTAEKKKITVAGNLPYNISSQILIRLIGYRSSLNRAVLMFQKELAQRIAAQPGTKTYGRITILLQYCAEIRSVMAVRAGCFYPKPKIDSEVVEIRFMPEPKHPAIDEGCLFSVVKAAFSKRRKTLKNALGSSSLFAGGQAAEAVLEAVDIDPDRRAETVSVEEFVALSNAIASQG